jgi:hypothetical protein
MQFLHCHIIPTTSCGRTFTGILRLEFKSRIFSIPEHDIFETFPQNESHTYRFLDVCQSILPPPQVLQWDRTYHSGYVYNWLTASAVVNCWSQHTARVDYDQHVSLFGWQHEAAIDCVEHHLPLRRSWLPCTDESSTRIACVLQLDALGGKIFVRSFGVLPTHS